MGDEFKVDPPSLRSAADQMVEHAGEVESHGQVLGSSTAGRVGRGPIGEVVESAVKRGIKIVEHDISAAVKKFYRDVANVLKKTAEETERSDMEAASRFSGLEHRPHDGTSGGTRAVVSSEPSGGDPVGPAPGSGSRGHLGGGLEPTGASPGAPGKPPPATIES